MRHAVVVFAAALAASACTLVIGTSTRTLVEGGGPDGSDLDAEVDAYEASDDAPPPPDSGCTPTVIVGCVAEAGVCGATCASQYTGCYNACNNNKPCQQSCASTKTSCESLCAATCFQCTVGTGCPSQGACDDASAK